MMIWESVLRCVINLKFHLKLMAKYCDYLKSIYNFNIFYYFVTAAAIPAAA